MTPKPHGAHGHPDKAFHVSYVPRIFTGPAFTTEASARMAAENGLGQMSVAGAGLDEMTAQVRRFNAIRAETAPRRPDPARRREIAGNTGTAPAVLLTLVAGS
jgi:hypothetical protein